MNSVVKFLSYNEKLPLIAQQGLKCQTTVDLLQLFYPRDTSSPTCLFYIQFFHQIRQAMGHHLNKSCNNPYTAYFNSIECSFVFVGVILIMMTFLQYTGIVIYEIH